MHRRNSVYRQVSKGRELKVFDMRIHLQTKNCTNSSAPTTLQWSRPWNNHMESYITIVSKLSYVKLSYTNSEVLNASTSTSNFILPNNTEPQQGPFIQAKTSSIFTKADIIIRPTNPNSFSKSINFQRCPNTEDRDKKETRMPNSHSRKIPFQKMLKSLDPGSKSGETRDC